MKIKKYIVTVCIFTLFVSMSLSIFAQNDTSGVNINAVSDNPVTHFTDMSGHWSEASVERLTKAGIINGYPDGTFKPDALVSRAEVAKIICLAFGLEKSKELDYQDVKPDDWYYSYVARADQYMQYYGPYEIRPYTAPYIDNNYRKDQYFLPQQADLRMFLAETLSVLKAERDGVEIHFPEYSVIQSELSETFIDGHFAEEIVDPHGNIPSNKIRMEQYCWAAWKMGIFEGDDNRLYGPMEPVTRAALVVTVDRILNPADAEEPENPVESITITDSWEQIIASVNDKSYKSKYHIGDVKEIDLGSEGVVEMQIAAFDADELADGSGKAAITWISKQLLKSDHRMNPSIVNPDPSDPSKVLTGTGNAGGWEYSEMRAWLKKDIKSQIPSTVQDAIQPVKKYSTSIDPSGTIVMDASSAEDVWIPSVREVYGSIPNYKSESEGPVYAELFASGLDRIKQKTGSAGASAWWLRSTSYVGSLASHSFIDVGTDGSGKFLTDFTSVDSPEGVALGFCM